MLQNFLKEQAEKSDISADILKKEMDTRQPIGHIGDPIDIAYGVLYLVSNEAKFVTGSELVIDGGYTAT
jgi:NAD(P)-dependent dehydrogenase (short-subunit alcohol dehydrogenase family)